MENNIIKRALLVRLYSSADEATKKALRADCWERKVVDVTKEEVDAKLASYGPTGHLVKEDSEGYVVWRVFRFAEVPTQELAALISAADSAKLKEIAESTKVTAKWVKFWSILGIVATIVLVLLGAFSVGNGYGY
jgi:hypothetical protein